MTGPFPKDVAFIDEGRRLEVEAFEAGRRSNQISNQSTSEEGLGEILEGGLGEILPAADDVIETEERIKTLGQFVPYVQSAFRDRGLIYPFQKAKEGDSLTPVEGSEDFAKQCAELSDLVGRDNAQGRLAKSFETRAVRALHQFIGGWAVCVGSPRQNRTGPKVAVEQFRTLLGYDKGGYLPESYAPSGDLGADAFWILGTLWCGPIVYFQAKNSPFSIRDIPEEFHRPHDILHEWFGRRMDCRSVIRVYAVNTVLTKDLKESAYLAAGSLGIHVLDAADILCAENLPANHRDSRDSLVIL